MLDALVLVVARGMERTPGGAAAASLLSTLPRRAAPGGGGSGGASASASAPAPATTAAALEDALRLGLLTSPHGEECAATAAAASAAALVLRNLSHTPANVTPLLSARTVIAIAAHAIAVEAASVAAPLEPGALLSVEEEAAAAERSAAVDDLLEMLLNLAPAMALVAPAGQAPPAVGGGAGGADAMPSRVAAAVCAALRSAAPRRAAAGAELLSRLYTRPNAGAFRSGGVFGTPSDVIPPLLSLLASHERDADGAGAAAAAAALARLAEVPAHCAAIAHAHGIVRTLLAAATCGHVPDSAARYSLATLAALAEAPGTPVAPAVMAADARLAAIVAAGGPGATYAARAVASTALFPSVWR
jgi:hypothetical protein